jgi:hypothetical protein
LERLVRAGLLSGGLVRIGQPRQTKCSHNAVRLVTAGRKSGGGKPNVLSFWQRCWGDGANVDMRVALHKIELKSLILAQIERWRHALHMQVERQRGGNPGGERRTGEEYIGTYPGVGDNAAKAALIPHML